MGLCIKCKTKQAVNKDRKCLDCSREYYRQFYTRRKELELCIKCHCQNNSLSLLCSVCSNKAVSSQNDRRIKAKKDFLCVICGCETDGQHTECEKCRDKRNDKYIKLSNKASFEGKCGQCLRNVPKSGLKTCDQCLERSRRHYLKIRHKRKKKNKNLKLLVWNHYGDKCVCCGENNEMLLNIDHINNDGSAHRRKIGSGVPIYKEIILLKFPDSYQLLCYNCNMGKYLNKGICPHQDSK